MPSLNKKNVNDVQLGISRDHPKMKLRGTRGKNCKKAKGDYQDQVHSDQIVLVIVRQVDWTA
jgi:hypothetical protein